MVEKKRLEDMTIDELKKELEFLKECIRDEEQTLNFMLHNTTLHLGGEQVRAMQEESEDKRREYEERIRRIEEMLEANTRHGASPGVRDVDNL
jgi:hypothetical protein